MKTLTVFGTRPEAVKMAPVVAELARHPQIDSRVLVTAQHRDMLDQVLEIFNITPDYDLDLMQPNQTPTDVLARVLLGLQPILADFRPDWVLVQGDTTTVLGAALAAVYARARVGHVEAGLRTYDWDNPFPEELNRVLTDHASSLHFAPTETSAAALRNEGIDAGKIHVTGNTAIDALLEITKREPTGALPGVPEGKRLILVTAHRRENHGAPLAGIIAALAGLAQRPDVHVIYPVHRNPNIWEPVHTALAGTANITLMPPLDYLNFAHLMARATLILTDSGGIQEEAPGLGKPVLVLRKTTERPEAVAAGTARLVGTDADVIVAAATELLDDAGAYAAMARAANPFGDGHAAERIVAALYE